MKMQDDAVYQQVLAEAKKNQSAALKALVVDGFEHLTHFFGRHVGHAGKA